MKYQKVKNIDMIPCSGDIGLGEAINYDRSHAQAMNTIK